MCFELNTSYTLLSSIFPIFSPIFNLALSKGVNKTYKKTFIFITPFSIFLNYYLFFIFLIFLIFLII